MSYFSKNMFEELWWHISNIFLYDSMFFCWQYPPKWLWKLWKLIAAVVPGTQVGQSEDRVADRVAYDSNGTVIIIHHHHHDDG